MKFRVNVGERQNAEPRWIMPLICRRGEVEGRDVGAITITKRSTIFEISAAAADRFELRATAPDAKEPKIVFARVLPGQEGDDLPPTSPRPAARTFASKPVASKTPVVPPPDYDDEGPPRTARVMKPIARTPEGYDPDA